VLNVITGYGDPVGQTLAEDPRTDFLSFTGSSRVGQLVGGIATSRIKRVGLELGGKGPQVVFADANMAAAADAVGRSIFGDAGQACVSGSRLIIQRAAQDEMLDRLSGIAGKVTIGDPLDDKVKVGSLIHRPHMEKVERYVGEGQRDGATLAFGGRRLSNAGNYYAPTVFTDVRPEMSIFRDEIFGPVLSVTSFDTPEQAVALANDTSYGLSANVWSQDITKALQTIRKVRAGRTSINGGGGSPAMAIGGYKQSGIGRELGSHGFDEYSQLKGISIGFGVPAPWVG
jgi:acyl-CoA reductase-like NAD-dependent aldehyde dehydrogenase